MTRIVGIVNLTPDSFSGDGVSAAEALEKCRRLLSEGADILDIGAESTRPQAGPVSASMEWQRLASFLPQVRREFPNAILSIDTRHAATATRALKAGVDWVNDVTGFENAAMRKAVRKSTATLVAMHALSVPPKPGEVISPEIDSIDFLAKDAARRLEEMGAAGIAKKRVIYDPGIGFGKSPAHALEIIQRIDELKIRTGLPLLVGHSRKSFLRHLPETSALDPDAGTLVLSRGMIEAGVDYLRVHDVASHVQLRSEIHG